MCIDLNNSWVCKPQFLFFDIILYETIKRIGMTVGFKATKVAILTRKERLVVKLLFQSKARLALISLLVAAPLLGSSGLAFWFYSQNRALAHSTREVVGELEILNKEIEALSRRAGIPRVSPEGLSSEALTQSLEGRGGVPQPIQPGDQLEIAKSKLPLLSKRLEQETKPALEKKLEKEALISKATPSGNPVQGSFEVSSDFGVRPNPYGGAGYEGHDGIDILGAHGTPIYATASGTAIRAQFGGGYGYHVLIKTNQGFETLYAHLSKLAIAPNAPIEKGQLIGYMGNTGRSTGTHLHYSVYHQGKAVDPKSYMNQGWRYSEGFYR